MKKEVADTETKIGSVASKLAQDENDYLKKLDHDLICAKNNSDVKLHINEVVRKQREDSDKKFAELWRRLDQLAEMIKLNGHSK